MEIVFSPHEVRSITLAFFSRDLTVKPSVCNDPVGRIRAFVSRRGEVTTAIICCQLLESVSISHISAIDFLYTVCWQRPLETRIAKKQASSFSSMKRHLSFHEEMFELNRKKNTMIVFSADSTKIFLYFPLG